jgi:hypothetical protein
MLDVRKETQVWCPKKEKKENKIFNSENHKRVLYIDFSNIKKRRSQSKSGAGT